MKSKPKEEKKKGGEIVDDSKVCSSPCRKFDETPEMPWNAMRVTEKKTPLWLSRSIVLIDTLYNEEVVTVG